MRLPCDSLPAAKPPGRRLKPLWIGQFEREKDSDAVLR
jgi:hypothetical protein